MDKEHHLRILVCDDEAIGREYLVRAVTDLGHLVVAQASNGIEAIEMVNLHQPDVVLLDVRMPVMDGIECAKALSKSEKSPAIIFVSAFDKFAIDAFTTGAVGYLIKPANTADIESALQRAKRIQTAQLSHLKALGDQSTNKQRNHLVARTHKGIELIPLDNIYYFLADQKYVTVRHFTGQVLIDETLKELEQEFGDRFLRVHRNALIAEKYLDGLEVVTSGQYQVKLKNVQERLLISRRHLPEIRDRMKQL